MGVLRLFLMLTAAILLVVPAAFGHGDEDVVDAALRRLLTLARAGDREGLAQCLACYTGVPGPETLHVRPCALPADSARVEAVAAHFRAAYGADTPYVIDWFASNEEEGVRTHRIQVKVRSTSPPELVEYRFLALGDGLLLADAGSDRLEPPDLPPPASPREEAERVMQKLFHLAASDRTLEAAAHIACPDPERRTLLPCDHSGAGDRGRVEDFCERLAAFLQRVGPTGWGFTGYRTKDEREGMWHVLEIGYLDESLPEGKGTAYAAFIRAGDGLCLGDLEGWPE